VKYTQPLGRVTYFPYLRNQSEIFLEFVAFYSRSMDYIVAVRSIFLGNAFNSLLDQQRA